MANPSEPKFSRWERDGRNIVESGRGIVAIIPTPQNGGTFDCEENARLIAAAPDLYEALQAAYDELQDEHGTMTISASLARGCACTLCKRILAALKKAGL